MSIVLVGSTSGSITLQEPAVAGSNTVNFGANTGVAILDANTPAFRNRILNGGMVLDQRNAGASVTPVSGAYTLDRYQAIASQASKFSVQQNAGSVTPPAGFTNYLGVTSLSAYTVGASEVFNIVQKIEGFNTADLDFGKSTAKTVTLSFWVRSSLTGTFGGALQNSAQTRSYPFSFTISAANTWEYETITITGDTSGTWVGATNGIGLLIWFGLGVGSTFSGTAGAWAGSDFRSATGATSVVGTNGATFYITGVQLEKGSTATAFDNRDYGTELMLCQRYYAKMIAGSGTYTNFGIGYQTSTTGATIFVKYPTTMRSSPTFSQSNCAINDTLTFTAAVSLGAAYAGSDSTKINVTFSPSGGATHRPVDLLANNNTAAYLDMSAEL